MKEISW